MLANLENSAVATGLEKVNFSFQLQRKAVPKNLQTATQLHSSHTLAKKMLKISTPGFNSTWMENFQMFKLDFEKAEEPEIKLPTSTGSSKKHRIPEKLLLLLYWLCQSLCMDHNKLWKILQEMGIPDLPPKKSVHRSRSNSLNWTWNNRLLPNWERSMSRLYVVTLLI